jgi:predicted ATPase
VSLEAFGVKNLRCLTDTGLVPIRPITVLVGRNSSGKSTFLRAFPLLRQSVETARNSPILWYHEKYVDFGSFKDAANNRLSEPSVTFQFRLRLPELTMDTITTTTIDIAMTLAGGENPYISTYDILLNGSKRRWELDSEGRLFRVILDGKIIELQESMTLQGKAYLFPAAHAGSVSDVSYHAATEALEAFPDIFKLASSWQLSPLPLMLADRILPPIISRVAYLAPLRVSPERDYRIQNLAVNEVDPRGENLAMFLRSLSSDETESFASFTHHTLGFETQVRTTGLRAEILVKEGKTRPFVNLIDVGFGYSEVLPLAAVLWSTCVRPTMTGNKPAPIMAIEQPELHLHPAHQAKLARMLVEAVQKSRTKSDESKILIETHSESLINGLGKLIYEGAIKAEDVQIVLFDQDEETGQTTVRLAGYRADGSLHDWPYGFLSAAGWHRVPSAAE